MWTEVDEQDDDGLHKNFVGRFDYVRCTRVCLCMHEIYQVSSSVLGPNKMSQNAKANGINIDYAMDSHSMP